MAYKADEVKVGFVIVLSLLILAGFIILIAGLKIGQPMETYTATLRFAGGIDPGTIVRFGGMQVGKITAVDVSGTDDTRIQFTMSIKEDTPIKSDSEVFINTIGFLGEYYLEISTGSQGATLLPPGSQIPSREIASLNDILAQAQSAVEKADGVMLILNERILTEDLANLRERMIVITDKMAQLLTDVDEVFNEENRENISRTLEELRRIVQQNREDIHKTVANFRSASERLESLAVTLDSLASENRDDVDVLIADIRAAIAQTRSAAERIESLVAENADNIAATVDNLKTTTANTRDFSETIADEPWRLIWRTRQPEKRPFGQKEAQRDER